MKYKKIIKASALALMFSLALTSCKEKKDIITLSNQTGTKESQIETTTQNNNTTNTNTTEHKTNEEIEEKTVLPQTLSLNNRKKVIFGNTYYASPTGSEYASGDRIQPFDLPSAFNHLNPGDTLVVLDGTYVLNERIVINGIANVTGIKFNSTKNGTASLPITVKSDEGAHPVLDFSNLLILDQNRGISLNANYWRFYGLDVMGAGDNGMYIGGSYNIVENCTFHENQDTGLQLGRASGDFTTVKEWPHNNLIKNCTSYNNYDYNSYGENADGFAAKLTVGNANVFDGCIAYRNADDGWDLYAKSDTSNVGTTIIINCVAFENGWLLEKMPSFNKETDLDENGISTITTTRKMLNKTTDLSYTTRDGDGIGFKLGGSSMEGDVIVRNCLSFNNRLHGFSDNSNPGILSLSNCTAYNNSVSVDPENGAVLPSDNSSNNFDTARTEQSYNNYYGLLSYTTNQTNPTIGYSNRDKFRGSCGYSIFNCGKGKYNTFTDYQDANSYKAIKSGTAFNDLNDDSFDSLNFEYVVNSNRNLHTLLRNNDFSINMASMCDIKDPTLLSYCQGKQIGSKLNYSSWDDYIHYDFSFFDGYECTEDEALLYGSKDALTLMCNLNAVYQDLNLLSNVNGIKVKWTSSDENIISIGQKEYKTLSNVTYFKGIVNRDRNKNAVVTLTATLEINKTVIQKQYDITVMKDIPEVGKIVGLEDRYIQTQFSKSYLPEINVLNASSYSGKTLILGEDYDYDISVLYAKSKADFLNGNFYDVSKVYTSLTGTYKVTFFIHSKIDNQELEASYFIFVVSEDANIDVLQDEKEDGTTEELYDVNVSRDGVVINANFTNILGNMYVYASKTEITNSNEIISKGQRYDITDDSIRAVYQMPNNEEYFISFVVTNKNGGSISKVYSKLINVVTISTNKEFNDLVSGQTSQTTIYLLTNDLDFSNYNFKISTNTFGGLFNGNGYTIKNLSVNGQEKKDAAIFNKLKNGTIMNVMFENIVIVGKPGVATVAGIVGQMTGGYIHNISLKNVSVSAHTGAGAMVGQVCGGINYISQVQLLNDDNSNIIVTGKYCGGIVANIQKDTTEPIIQTYITNCFVKGVIGDGKDSGGYVGGIVGRIKNDYNVCKTEISKCVFEGQVRTGKNYCGGICAGTDNGAGDLLLTRCISNCTIYFAGTLLDGLSDGTMAAKNCSPVYGRKTVGLGLFVTMMNYGSFADTQISTDSEDFYNLYKTKGIFTSVALDLDNIWLFDEETKTISLRFTK